MCASAKTRHNTIAERYGKPSIRFDWLRPWQRSYLDPLALWDTTAAPADQPAKFCQEEEVRRFRFHLQLKNVFEREVCRLRLHRPQCHHGGVVSYTEDSDMVGWTNNRWIRRCPPSPAREAMQSSKRGRRQRKHLRCHKGQKRWVRLEIDSS